MDPRPLDSQKTTDTEIEAFLGNFTELKVSCGFLDLMVPAEPCNETPLKFPLTPRLAQAKTSAQIIQECPLPPSIELLSSYCDKFVSMITPSDDQ